MKVGEKKTDAGKESMTGVFTWRWRVDSGGPKWQSRLLGTSWRCNDPCSLASTSFSLSLSERKERLFPQTWTRLRERLIHQKDQRNNDTSTIKVCRVWIADPLPALGTSVHSSLTFSSTMLQWRSKAFTLASSFLLLRQLINTWLIQWKPR